MLLTYAVLIENKQTALNLLNNKQTIYLMSLSVQPNTRKEARNPQLSQFDPATNDAPERYHRAPYLKRYKLM